jgi:hypothetical protein
MPKYDLKNGVVKTIIIKSKWSIIKKILSVIISITGFIKRYYVYFTSTRRRIGKSLSNEYCAEFWNIEERSGMGRIASDKGRAAIALARSRPEQSGEVAFSQRERRLRRSAAPPRARMPRVAGSGISPSASTTAGAAAWGMAKTDLAQAMRQRAAARAAMERLNRMMSPLSKCRAKGAAWDNVA